MPLIDRRERLIWLACYAAVLVTRVILIAFPPAAGFYDQDELDMVNSVLDRFLGVPSVALAWPGSTLQLLSAPVYGLWLLAGCLQSGRDATNLSCLALGLGRLYLDPSGALDVMRLLSAAIASATPVLVGLIIRRLGGAIVPALIAAFWLASLGLVWRYGAMATGDVASITFSLAALLVALTGASRSGRSFLSGLLVGAALSSKLTVLGLACSSGVAVLLRPARLAERGAAFTAWAAGATVGFVALCPYVWVDPIRLLKSTLGNLTRSGESAGISQPASLLAVILGPLVWLALPLAALGLVMLASSRSRRRHAVMLVAALAMIAVPLISAGSVYPRYGLPLVTVLMLPVALGIGGLLDVLRPASRAVVVSFLCLSAAAAFAQNIRTERDLRAPAPVLEAIRALLADRSLTEIYLPTSPTSAFPHALSYLSSGDIERMLRRARINAPEIVSFVASRGIDRDAAAALINNFNEDEQMTLARLTVMRLVTSPSTRSIHFYDATGTEGVPRLAFNEYYLGGAISAFRASGGPAAILLERAVPGLAPTVEDWGEGCYVYRKPASGTGRLGLTADPDSAGPQGVAP